GSRELSSRRWKWHSIAWSSRTAELRFYFRRCFFLRERRRQLIRSGHRDHHDADQNEQSSQNRSQTQRFTTQEISDQYGDNRIYVCVGSDSGWRLMMNQPYVRSKSDDGARDNQVDQRKPRSQ